MFTQIPKSEIDIGEIGNASTGDILYDGGKKINDNFDAIYNLFGDQRFYDKNTQVGNQTIHATGYYQKVNQYDLRLPLAMGTLWDVDTTTGAANPILAQGKPGECIRFINSNGSCSVNSPIEINPTAGSFIGVQGALVITQPNCLVECWCVSNENNVAIWNYSISSMFGSKETPIEVTKTVPISGGVKLPIAHSSEYNAIKLLVTAQSADGTKIRQSETNLLVDNLRKNIHDTEFAVMRVGNSGENDDIVDIKYDIGTDGKVVMSVTTTYQNMRISVKSIAVQRVGTA